MQVELTSTPANSTIPTLPSCGSADGSASPFAALLQDHTPTGAAEAVALQSKDVPAAPPETPQAEIESYDQSVIEAWIKGQKPAPLVGTEKTVANTAAKTTPKAHAKKQTEAADAPTPEPTPDSHLAANVLVASALTIPIQMAPPIISKATAVTQRAGQVDNNSETNSKQPAIAQAPQPSSIPAQEPQVGPAVGPQEPAAATADGEQKVTPVHTNLRPESTAEPQDSTNAAKLEKPNHSEDSPAKPTPSDNALQQSKNEVAAVTAQAVAPNAMPISIGAPANVGVPAAVPKPEFVAHPARASEKAMQPSRDTEKGIDPQLTGVTPVSHSTPNAGAAGRAKNQNSGSENRQDQSHKGSQISSDKSPSLGVQQPIASQEPTPAATKDTVVAPTHTSIPPAAVGHSADAAPQSASTPAVNTHSNLQQTDVSSRASMSTPLVSGARLIAHQHYSELQLKIHSEDLGAVQIRATMRAGQIGAAITADRPEAREALSSAMPALHQALRDRDVRVEQISVIDHSQASNDFNLGSGSQQSGTPQQNKQNITQASYSPAEGLAVTSAETERPVVNESALVDVHA